MTESMDYYVVMSPDSVLNTGLGEVEISTRNGKEISRTVVSSYLVMYIGGYLMIAKTGTASRDKLEGVLVDTPEEVKQEIERLAEIDDFDDYFLPIMFERRKFRTAGNIVTGISLLYVIILATYGLRNLRVFRDPQLHPVLRRLAKQGPLSDLSRKIESEFKMNAFPLSDACTLTPSYLVRISTFSFSVIRIDDILWVYIERTKNSVNFVPIGSTYKLRIVSRESSLKMDGPKSAVEQTIDLLYRRVPWAEFGYSHAIRDQYNYHTEDFYRSIETRKQNILRKLD